MDELTTRIDLHPMPLTWPVGVAGDFRGVLDCATGDFVQFTRTPGGATEAIATRMSAAEAERSLGSTWTDAVEEYDLLTLVGPRLRPRALPLGRGVAGALRLGRAQLRRTPAARHARDARSRAGRRDPTGPARPATVSAPFSGFVFKIQAGMDRAHRDRLAFVRVCSGRFSRGMVVTHADTGRPFATKYAQSVFGRDRSTLDEAFPGDVIGLVNANALRVGDPDELRGLRAAMRAWMDDHGVAESVRHALLLAVGEACANAVEHAYRDGAAGDVHVDIAEDVDRSFAVFVRDFGRFRERSSSSDDRGRGTDIMRRLATEFAARLDAVRDDGTIPPPDGRPDIRMTDELAFLRREERDGIIVVHLRGEIDLSNAEELHGRIHRR